MLEATACTFFAPNCDGTVPLVFNDRFVAHTKLGGSVIVSFNLFLEMSPVTNEKFAT